VNAKDVVLFAEDIVGGKMWASTELESLELGVFVRKEGTVGYVRPSQEDQESALFRRIAKLVKLNRLSLRTGWDGERTLRDESWLALLGMETLKSIELGYELGAPSDRGNFETLFAKNKRILRWS
jgi:hypothetical protein